VRPTTPRQNNEANDRPGNNEGPSPPSRRDRKRWQTHKQGRYRRRKACVSQRLQCKVPLEERLARRGEGIGGCVKHHPIPWDGCAAMLTPTARRPDASPWHRGVQGGSERGEPLLRVILTTVTRRDPRSRQTLRRGVIAGALRLYRRLRNLECQDTFADHPRASRRVLPGHQARLYTPRDLYRLDRRDQTSGAHELDGLNAQTSLHIGSEQRGALTRGNTLMSLPQGRRGWDAFPC
jgi:hypothetical protein